MTRDTVTVQVRDADGALEPRTRTLYSTVHGPMFTSILGLPLFPWTPDARRSRWATPTRPNFRYLNHFFEVDQRAEHVRELDAILKRNQGIPWVNTIAADSTGRGALRRHLGDAATCPTPRRSAATRALGRGDVRRAAGCRCSTARARPATGATTPTRVAARASSARRTCRACSATTTSRTPTTPTGWPTRSSRSTGFARIIGDERTARSLRTRSGW